MNLLRHRVPVSGACNPCHFAFDSTCHSLFFCFKIKNLWKDTTFWNLLRKAKDASTLDLCFLMQSHLSKEEFERFAIHTWAIWKERQKVLHGDGQNSLTDVSSWSAAVLNDFRKANLLDGSDVASTNHQADNTWKPPDKSLQKLNVDACVNESASRFSVGGVLREKMGRLLMAFGQKINQPISVLHGELQAIQEGIKLVYEKNFQDAQVETDSLI